MNTNLFVCGKDSYLPKDRGDNIDSVIERTEFIFH